MIRTTLLITLLLHAVVAKQSQPDLVMEYRLNETNMNCAAFGKWDSFYEHYVNSCEKLGVVTCKRYPVTLWGEARHRWTCRFEEVEDYIVDTRVDDDKTLHVKMTSRFDVHPVIYIVTRLIFLLLSGLFFCAYPQFTLGLFAGLSILGRSTSPRWVEHDSWTD